VASSNWVTFEAAAIGSAAGDVVVVVVVVPPFHPFLPMTSPRSCGVSVMVNCEMEIV
jgi:hypothetical protein